MAEILNIENIFGILSILLQLGAAYFAFRLIKITGAFRAWILVIVAFVLMSFRRVTALLITLGAIPQLTGVIGIIDRLVLPLIISICLIWGMHELFKIFLKYKE